MELFSKSMPTALHSQFPPFSYYTTTTTLHPLYNLHSTIILYYNLLTCVIYLLKMYWGLKIHIPSTTKKLVKQIDVHHPIAHTWPAHNVHIHVHSVSGQAQPISLIRPLGIWVNEPYVKYMSHICHNAELDYSWY